MPSFAYRAFDKTGRERRATIDAGDAVDARNRLKASGLTVASLEEGGPAAAKASSVWGARVNYHRLFSDLAMLTNAGLPFDAALRAIASGAATRANRSFAATLAQRVEGGSSLSQALTDAPSLRPDIVALIASGERSGRLPHVLAAIGEELERQASQRKAIVDAAVYPAFLVVMMIAALAVITFVLVPAIAPVFETAGKAPPLIISVLSGVREALLSPEVVVFGACAFGLLAVLALLNRGLLAKTFSGLILHLPMIGTFRRKSVVARYLQTLALLLGNSVPMEAALLLAAEGCPIPQFRPALMTVRSDVTAGKRLPHALSASQLFPAATLSLVSIGDEVNALPTVLSKSSDILFTENQGTVDKMLALLTPLVTIVMGSLIGGLVISVMTALLGINDLSAQ